MKLVPASLRVVKEEIVDLLRIDIPAALMVALMLLTFLPTIARYADNAALLHTFVDDEPLITMELDGMTEWPWGDPSTYIDENKHASHPVPPYWLNIRYDGIVYYGGLYPDLAMLLWVPLKAIGFKIFPTGPIVLRALSLLFSIFTVLAVYNFGRKHFGLFAGLFGALFLLTEYHFISIGTVVHPDSLLFFLTLLALPLCIRHAEEGTMESLVAAGIVAGLAQGAKMGGVLVAPIVAASVVYGGWGTSGFVPTVLRRGVIVSAVAVIVFFLTTPYAAVDPYFFKTWSVAAALLSGQSPIEQVTFLKWLATFVLKVSAPLLAAAGIAACAHYLLGRERLTLLFTLFLCAWVVLWYAQFQRFWVQPQYLIVSYALVAIIGWSLVDRLIVLSPVMMPKAAVAIFAACAVAAMAVVKQDRITGALSIPFSYFGWREATRYQVGAWLAKNKHGVGETVMFDTQAYFDPSDFTRQFPNGGPIHWTDLARVKPDYFALTVYGSGHWMGQKMAQQQSEQWDPDYYNLRLYQDLLGTDPDKPTATNSIWYIATLQKFEPLPAAQQCEAGPLFTRAMVTCIGNAVLGEGIGPRGPAVWLFKLNPDGLRGRP
jgi:4-amino-4-deoxy-L-arabinose transferase-like glycosyltransferase